jgi:hypothetical protein
MTIVGHPAGAVAGAGKSGPCGNSLPVCTRVMCVQKIAHPDGSVTKIGVFGPRKLSGVWRRCNCRARRVIVLKL